MKVCYVDESGTGDEPVATMVGIIVDSQRMHVTKAHWNELLDVLSKIVGKKLAELHTRDFYAGSGVWYQMKGPDRAKVITAIFEWLKERKHHIVYSAVVKEAYYDSLCNGKIPKELSTPWRFLALHLILAIQKRYQREEKTKGNTIIIFDNEERERTRITDLINLPPAWCDTYYDKQLTQERLDQIVDVPYFGDSAEVPLIQVADFVTFFLRRYAEIKGNHTKPRYVDEPERIEEWAKLISSLSIGRSHIYPLKGRCPLGDIFFSHAPKAIREM
ncbi:MAG: DUF3800 domain-containing protein [Methanolobus sp.]|uniref:DUF3800 domain-containing protein n=1 Tax=Methanolobus sp. TaxID=1874737 RepID=UPI00272F1867|nr:DUF3800 domain-containing protein [Methanolobus sp.]MDP2217497.1 DUF3800 domain-containing protein [Methanolobus sp.]